jgi:hypothetical protein
MTRDPHHARGSGERWVPLAFGAFCLAVLAANGT